NEVHLDQPAFVGPVVANCAELHWLWRWSRRYRDAPDGADLSAGIRENHVAEANVPHVLVGLVECTVGVAVGRPQVAAANLVFARLLVIDPLKRHDHSPSRPDQVTPSAWQRATGLSQLARQA